jgi:hypothetical protein
MHALFRIKTVIIPRDQYPPEGFSPRVDIGRGMITILLWKKACINLFITYFNIELKKTKLTSHTDTKLMDMSDRYWLRVLLPKRQQIFPLWTSTFSKRQLTVGRKWRHGAHERLDIVLLEFFPPISAHGLISLWHFRCLRMGKIDVVTYKDVINEKWHVMICVSYTSTEEITDMYQNVQSFWQELNTCI